MESAGPGAFQTSRMEPGFSFELAEGWLPIFPESSDLVNMRLPEQAVLFVMRSSADSVESAIAVAESGGLTLENEESVTVGGLEAVRFEVGGSSATGLIVQTPTGEFTVFPEMEAPRLTLLDVDGITTAIMEVAPKDRAAESRMESWKVIETIRWVAN